MQHERELGTVLVTGGASGLGAAVAGAVATHGGRPVVLDLNMPGDGLAFQQVDLADRAATERAVHTVSEEHGPLHGIVTAAGTDSCGPLADVAREDWERVVKVNLLGTAAVIRAALPDLRRQRGRIVTVASTLGARALPDATAYCASKFGVVGMTRALMAELGDEVGVTLLMPGGMDTAFFDGREDKYRPGPDADLASPDDVAAAVVFALTRPNGVDLREMLVSTGRETSWP